MIEVFLPGLKLNSLNAMLSLSTLGARLGAAKRTKNTRALVAMVLRSKARRPPSPPLLITITRVGPRKLDTDNLAGSAKAVRDGIADWLGINDGSELLEWRYEQKRGQYGVEIRAQEKTRASADV